MSTTAEELTVIHAHVYPALTGMRRFKDFALGTTHLGFSETAVFQSLLSTLKPALSIEVGTETGATLALLARHSAKVVSIDIDPAVKLNLASEFPNVEFITGSSHDALPALLGRLAVEGTTPDFIFVDGDHSAEGVRKDLDAILRFQPQKRMVVLMHDTINPGCRRGICAAAWSRNVHCHYVDLDFCPGVLHPDESCRRQMWGGLGFALFLPEPRKHKLAVKLPHQMMFEAAFLQSVYNQARHR